MNGNEAIKAELMDQVALAIEGAYAWADAVGAEEGKDRPGRLAIAADVVQRLGQQGFGLVSAQDVQDIQTSTIEIMEKSAKAVSQLGEMGERLSSATGVIVSLVPLIPIAEHGLGVYENEAGETEYTREDRALIENARQTLLMEWGNLQQEKLKEIEEIFLKEVAK